MTGGEGLPQDDTKRRAQDDSKRKAGNDELEFSLADSCGMCGIEK